MWGVTKGEEAIEDGKEMRLTCIRAISGRAGYLIRRTFFFSFHDLE